jgi:hypothetical protein
MSVQFQITFSDLRRPRRSLNTANWKDCVKTSPHFLCYSIQTLEKSAIQNANRIEITQLIS